MLHDAAVVAAGIATLGVFAFLLAYLWAAIQPPPPTAPSPPPERDRVDYEKLLTFEPWRKRAAEASLHGYTRPLDVSDTPDEMPADGILLPPRDVQGRNNEP